MPLKFGIIEQTVHFNASPQELFDALLDHQKHSEFTGSPAATSRRTGARFTAGGGYISGKNIKLVKDRMIVQEWNPTERPEGYPSSRLEFTLTAKKNGTRLKMVHSKVPAERLEDYRKGWHTSYPVERILLQASDELAAGPESNSQLRKRSLKHGDRLYLSRFSHLATRR